MLIIGDASEFKSHKQVLCAISSVMKNIFDGDSAITKIEIKGFTEKAMELFYNLIYDTPAQRKERLKTVCLHKTDVVDVLKLSAKYDIKLLRDFWALTIGRIFWRRGTEYTAVLDCCVALGFTEIADALKRSHIEMRNCERLKLDTFPKDLILEMIQENNFENNKEFVFFDKAARYLFENKDAEIEESLKKIGIPGNAWKKKFMLEKKKSDTAISLLRRLF